MFAQVCICSILLQIGGFLEFLRMRLHAQLSVAKLVINLLWICTLVCTIRIFLGLLKIVQAQKHALNITFISNNWKLFVYCI